MNLQLPINDKSEDFDRRELAESKESDFQTWKKKVPIERDVDEIVDLQFGISGNNARNRKSVSKEKERVKKLGKKKIHIHKRALSHLSTLSIAIQCPGHWNVISGMAILEGHLSQKEVENVVRDRLYHKHFRLRAKLSSNHKSLHEFVGKDEFDVKQHVHHIELKTPDYNCSNDDDDDEERLLKELLTKLDNKELDMSKPLWEIYNIENYSKGNVLFVRMHHCLGDGVSIAYALTCMSDGFNERVEKREIDKSKEKRPLLNLLWNMMVNIYKRIIFLMWIVYGCVYLLIRNIFYFRHKEPESIFYKKESKQSMEVGHRMLIDYSCHFSVEGCKKIGRMCSAKLNDVILACIAGAMQRYRRRFDIKFRDKLSIRFSLPVNLRERDVKELGNHYGLYMSGITLEDQQDSLERLKRVKENMDECKKLPEPYITNFFILLLHYLSPSWLTSKIFRFLSRHFTFCSSNVCGPSDHLFINNHKILHIVGWVPPPQGISIGFLCMSYHGNLYLSVKSDESCITYPDVMIQMLEEEYDYMLSLAEDNHLAKESHNSNTDDGDDDDESNK